MSRAGYVYVIEAQNGFIKIGYGESPRNRATAVATHSPIPTRLVATIPATQRQEAEIHELFAAFRNHREWFRVEGPVVAFLEMVRGRGIASVPAWDACLYVGQVERRRRGAEIRSRLAKERWANPEWREPHLALLKAHRERRRAA